MSHETGAVRRRPGLHAVQRTLSGPRAICGAGAITARIPGRFDPEHELSCVGCVVVARTSQDDAAPPS